MAEGDPKDYRSLGEIIRASRKDRGMSIDDVSGITKISPKVLHAIEADDLDGIADPIYAKSFVRTLAETFDLDTRFLLTKLEFASVAVQQASAAPRRDSTGPSPDDSTWHIEDVRIQRVETPTSKGGSRWILGVVVILVLALAGLWFMRRSTTDDPASNASAGTSLANPSSQFGTLVDPVADAPIESRYDSANAETDDVRPESPADEGATDEADPPQTTPVTTPGEGSNKDAREEESTRTVSDTSVEEQVEETLPDPEPEVKTPDPEPEPEQPAAQQQDTAPATSEATSTPTPEPVEEDSNEEVVLEEQPQGLESILRPGPNATSMQLVIRATARVEIHAAADGRGRQIRVLNQGDEWTLSAKDHFSLELSDPRRVEVELDGIRRDPPPGLSGEWILYPNRNPR